MTGYTKCRDCQERHIGCHGTCPDYIAFKSEREQELERINKEKANVAMLGTYVYEAKKRVKKRGHTIRSGS